MADNRIAYGLAKKYGIDTKGMTPKEVWDALNEKGVTRANAAEKYTSDGMGGEHEETPAEKKRLKELGVEKPLELSHEEKRAVYNYVSSWSYSLNDKLRNGYELSPDDKEGIKELDAALDKLPNYEGDLNRSMNFGGGQRGEEEQQKFMSGMKEGDIVTFPAYTSTNTADRVHMPNGDVQIKIRNSKKAKDLRAYNKEEKEILYGRNAKFKVKSVKSERFFDEDWYKERTRYFIELEEA